MKKEPATNSNKSTETPAMVILLSGFFILKNNWLWAKLHIIVYEKALIYFFLVTLLPKKNNKKAHNNEIWRANMQ